MEHAGEQESRAGDVYAAIGVFFPIAFIAVSLRFYTRLRFSHVGIDDILILLAFIMLVGFVAITEIGIQHGMTSHITTVPPENGVIMEKCGFASQVTYPAEMALVKISILLFLVRVLPATHPARLRLLLFAAFIGVTETVFVFCLVFQCSPVHAYWERDMPGRKCFNQPLFYYIDASFNIAFDLCILIIPTLLFRNLKIPRKQKWGVIALCSVGIFTLVSSILRLPYLHNLNQSQDPTWDTTNIVIWSCAEFSSSIIFACVPTLKPIYTRLRKRYWPKTHPSHSSATPRMSDWNSRATQTIGSADSKPKAQNLEMGDYRSLESLETPRATV